jgi:hypothetical protein
MSWRFALFLGGITGLIVYVTCFFIARYMDQPPLPLCVAVGVGLISAICQKYLEG